MTVPESEFHQTVREFLEESFASDVVEHEVVLEATDRVVDFRVSTPFRTYFVEVENSFEDIFVGVGQAEMYAGADGVPVVILPSTDDVEQRELKRLRAQFDGYILFVPTNP